MKILIMQKKTQKIKIYDSKELDWLSYTLHKDMIEVQYCDLNGDPHKQAYSRRNYTLYMEVK